MCGGSGKREKNVRKPHFLKEQPPPVQRGGGFPEPLKLPLFYAVFHPWNGLLEKRDVLASC